MKKHPFPKLYCLKCGKKSYHAWMYPGLFGAIIAIYWFL